MERGGWICAGKRGDFSQAWFANLFSQPPSAVPLRLRRKESWETEAVAKWTVSGPFWGVMQQAQPLHSFATYPFTDPENGYERVEGSVVPEVLHLEIGFTWYSSRWVRVRPPCGSCACRLKILHSPQSWMTHVSRSCGPAPGVGGGKGVFLSARIKPKFMLLPPPPPSLSLIMIIVATLH